MGICGRELKQYVIKPTLKQLGRWSPAAGNLLLGTAAVESGLGFHLHCGTGKQRGIGLFQITPAMHRDLWDGWLAFQPELASLVRGLASQHEFLHTPDEELATNLRYATAIAWLLYERNGAIPGRHDGQAALAELWRNHYPSIRPNKDVRDFEKALIPLVLEEKGIAA